MGIQLKNNAAGYLATAISASDTGAVLQTGNGASFPSLGTGDYFYATLESTGGTIEIVKVTARSGDSLTIVRAQDGSTAQSFAAGSRFELRVTAQSVRDVVDQVDASQVSYTPPFTGSVATNVGDKLAQTVSVKDFGAVGDGVADDTAAFLAALLYIQNSRVVGTAGPGYAGGTLFAPAGKYKITSSIEIGYGVTLIGEGVYASLLIFDGSISGAGSYCVSVGPSTVPGYTFGYTFGTRLANIGITCGGTENYGILVPGMHQHSIIDNVNLRSVGDIGIQLNGTGGPAYNVLKQVSIGSSNSTTATATGIVCNANAANSYFEAISIEAEYGQVFAIGVDVIATNVNFNTIHFAYCTKGIRLKAYAQGLYASDVSSYIRFAHDDASGPCTDLIYVDSGYAGGFVIEGTYSYAVPIGTLGCKILNNQITGQSIPSSKTVNFYRYPEWINVYTEPQTADPLYVSFTPAITADVDNTGDPLNQPAIVIKQTGTTYANFIPGYDNGFTISATNSFSFWPTGCRYVADVNSFVATTSGVDLGSAAYKWDTVYATNGTINTSDANEKQQVKDLSVAEKAVALAIKAQVKRFKFNSAVAEKGDAARVHVGVIAQDVEAAFKAHGLNPDDYGLFCRDIWYEVSGKKFDETTGKDYTADSPNAMSVTRLGVRYDELLAFIISAL